MTLRGNAFMAIWHDVRPEAEHEYSLWHTREHMPERVGVPGFERGRRYVAWNLEKYRYFTLYEGTTLDVFRSSAYREHLNAPTLWTSRLQPHYLNFVRSACSTIASLGTGIGGALATIRLNFESGGAEDFRRGAGTLAEQILKLDGVSGAHVGNAEPAVTRVRTKETELRQLTGEDIFDALVMVEGIGSREIAAVMSAIERILAASGHLIASSESGIYDLAYALTPGEALFRR